MDKVGKEIEKSAEYVKSEYFGKILESKSIFFEYLANGKNDFDIKMYNIWGNIDHQIFKDKVKELDKMLTKINADGASIKAPKIEYYPVKDLGFYIEKEKQFEQFMNEYFEIMQQKVKDYSGDVNTYLVNNVDKFQNNIRSIPYYSKGIVRTYQDIATYLSMCYTIDLRNSAWNTTLNDAEYFKEDLVILSNHILSCSLCSPYQGKVYSISGKNKKYPNKEVAINGGIGHPNCKHTWQIFWDESQKPDEYFDNEFWLEQYKIAQKNRAIERQMRIYETDISIYEKLGDIEKIEKTKKKYNKLESQIEKIKTNP